MTPLHDIQTIYTNYLEAAADAEKKAKPTDGMFGMGKKAADDPCHTAFYDALQTALQQLAASQPDPETAAEVLSLIYRMPAEHPDPPSIYWMLIAAHGLTEGLIPFLQTADAAALLTEYEKRFKRFGRLPVQKKICRLLQKKASP